MADYDPYWKDKIRQVRQQITALGKYLELCREILTQPELTFKDCFSPTVMDMLSDIAKRYSSNYENYENLNKLRTVLCMYG